MTHYKGLAPGGWFFIHSLRILYMFKMYCEQTPPIPAPPTPSFQCSLPNYTLFYHSPLSLSLLSTGSLGPCPGARATYLGAIFLKQTASFYQQIFNYQGPELGPGLCEPLSHPHWDFGWLCLVQVTTVFVSSWAQQPCMVQNTDSKLPPQRWLLQPSHPLFYSAPWALWGWGCDRGVLL